MKSLLAALRTLVLPSGATSGRRIVLDGVNGQIRIYDAAGLLRERIGFADAYELSSGDASELLLADLQALIIGAGNARQPELVIEAPQFPAPGAERPFLLLDAKSFDGTVNTRMQYAARLHDFIDSGAASADIQLNTRSLPRGLLDLLKGTANSGTAALGAETKDTSTGMGDLVFTAVAGRRYRIAFQGRINQSLTANTAAEVRIRDGGSGSPTTASTLLFAYPDFLAVAGGSGQVTHHGEAYFDCTTDVAAGTHTIAAFVALTAGGGGGTVNLAGSATQPKWLTVEDVGPNVNA